MSNPAAELEHGPVRPKQTSLDQNRTVTLAAWSFAAWVVLFIAVLAAPIFDETQREIRLQPDLVYDERVDFGYFYAAADLVWHGDLREIYPQEHEYIFYPGDPAFDLTNDEYLQARMMARGNYYNPPLLAILQAPLASMSYRDAFWTFSALSGLAFAGFLGLVWRAGRGVPELPVLIVGLAAFRPVHEVLIMGHLALFLVLALGAGFLALRGKQPLLAGLCFSFLALKPQWAILPGLFLLWRGEWRALATMAVGSAVLFFVPFVSVGVEGFKNYVTFLSGQSTADLGHAPHMFSWNGFLSKLVSNDFLAIPTGDVNKPLLYLLQGITVGVIALIWWGRDFYLGVAATVIGMLLLSTHSVWYDWAFLVVAAAFLVLRPAPVLVRAQVWVLLLAIFVSASQSVSAVFEPDGRHGFVHWSEAAFYSVTLVTFGALLWCAGRVVLEGQIRMPRWPFRAATA